ncbi:MAG: DUF5777 family beta-barrel protein [Acidobacteriota bacterium]|nr:DUF5777 family beta-barrel protein [Acidobacteriota bacterium]
MSVRGFVLGTTLSVLSITALLAFSSSSLPPLTGGFDEKTCHSCHSSFSLNAGRTLGGDFHITGVPENYHDGASYPITVLLSHPGQSRSGFQLSARSATSGYQAGQLVPSDDMTQVLEKDKIQYIQHTLKSTHTRTSNETVKFQFTWIAPNPSLGPILFNGTGNAADSSNDPTGDYIYTAGAYTQPSGITTELLTSVESKTQPTIRLNTTSRFMHLPAPVDLNRGDTETHIEHRFLQPLFDSSPGTAFGFDSSANINLGINHALTDDLTVGATRTRFDQVVAFMGTYDIYLKRGSFLQMSAVGGVEGERNFLSHYSTFLQLPTSIDFKRLRTLLVPTLILNSRDDEDLQYFSSGVNIENNYTFSLGIAADIALHPRVSLAGEYVPRLAGFGGFSNERSTISWGIKLRTRGHVFTILVTNTRDFTPAKYGVNAGTTDFALGFDLYRKSWK